MDILPQLILNSIIAGAIYTMIALGFTLIFKTVKFFDLGYGALTAVGGYIVFWLVKQVGGVPMPVAILAGVFGAGIVQLVANKLVYEPLSKKNASNMVKLVASLGVFTVLQSGVALLFTNQFRTLSLPGPQKVFNILGGYITLTQVIILGCGIVIAVGLMVLLNKTMFGKKIKAIGDDVEVAKIVGINTKKVINWVFLIGGAIAGLGGILVGFDTGLEPTMGLMLLLKGVIAAIIGGVGNMYGALLGAFLLGFVENFGVWQISGEWKDAIAFVLLIIFLLFKPEGILGKKKK